MIKEKSIKKTKKLRSCFAELLTCTQNLYYDLFRSFPKNDLNTTDLEELLSLFVTAKLHEKNILRKYYGINCSKKTIAEMAIAFNLEIQEVSNILDQDLAKLRFHEIAKQIRFLFSSKKELCTQIEYLKMLLFSQAQTNHDLEIEASETKKESEELRKENYSLSIEKSVLQQQLDKPRKKHRQTTFCYIGTLGLSDRIVRLLSYEYGIFSLKQLLATPINILKLGEEDLQELECVLAQMNLTLALSSSLQKQASKKIKTRDL